MQEFLEFTLGGIAVGMIYAAIALSLVLIWRGTRVLNYSQGGMAMFTTYIAWVVIRHTGNYWLGFVVALAAGLVLGAVLERTVVRPTEGKAPLNSVIVTIGLLILIEGVAGIIFGGQFRSFPPAFSVTGLKIGSVALGISPTDVFTAVAVLAAAVLLALVFRFTAVGLRLRATAFSQGVARLLGVRIGRVLTLGWALAGLFGALAGVLVTPQHVPLPQQHGRDLRTRVHGRGDRRPGQPGRRGRRRRAARRGAQLRRRLPGQRTGPGVRPGGAGPGPDDPARGPVLDRRDPEGVIMTLARHLAAAIVVAVVLVALSIQLGSYRDYQMAEVAAYVVAVAGLTVLIGLSGQISIGNGAFMAIGAYGGALLLIHLNWPLELVLLASVVVAAVSGGIFGLAAARLRGPYLAGATLMLAVALPSLADQYAGAFGGDQGLSTSINTPAFLGATFPPTRWLAWVTCAGALIILVLLANLGRSRVGRSWRAVRDDEVAASLAGLNVARLQILAFVVSAACAGLGGALLALVTGIVAPGAYTLTLSIGLLTAAVVGGLGSLLGAVWGSLLLVLVPTYLTNVASSHGFSGAASSSVPIAAYGVVLIVVMLVFPAGIQGGLRRLFGPAAPAAAAPINVLRRRRPASEHQEEGTT